MDENLVDCIEKLRSTVVYMCTAFQKDIIPAIKLIHVYAPNEYYRNYLMEKLKVRVHDSLLHLTGDK